MTHRLSRRAVVAFAIFAAVLASVAPPALALQQSTETFYLNHSTESELEAGTLTDTSVVGTGDDAYVGFSSQYVPVDSAEDGDLSEYVGATSDFSTVTSHATEGDYSIRGDASNDGIRSLSGLPNYPERGDTFSFDVELSSANPARAEIAFAVQGAGDGNKADGYIIVLESGSLQFWKDDFSTVLEEKPYASIPTGEMLTVTVDWGSDSDFHVTVNDTSGSLVGEMRATDSTYSGGGIGFAVGGGGSNVAWLDNYHINGGSASGTYVSDPFTASPDMGYVNFSTFTDSQAVVEWQGNDGGSWTTLDSTTYLTAGNYTTSLPETYDQYRTVVTFESLGPNADARLVEEGVRVTAYTPTASNVQPANGTTISDSTVRFSVDIDDPDFPDETVTAELIYDGSVLGSKSVSSAGTVNITAAPDYSGSNEWHWRLTDSEGATTTTEVRSLTTPSTLTVRNATSPHDLLDGVTLEIQFFAQQSDTVVTRTTTDGTVSLAGLPVNERFVVNVQPGQGFVSRRVVLDSIYEQQSVYLLNQTVDAAEVRFDLEDPTGQFPPESTYLSIEKPITTDGNTTYQAVASDTFGSTGSFAVVLQTGTRYRLQVTGEESSSSRILGAYTVYGASTETLQVQRIEPTSDAGQGRGAVYGAVETRESGRVIAVRFVSATNSTASVEYRVVADDGTIVVPNTTRTVDEFADIYPVDANQSSVSYTIEYTVVGEDPNPDDATVEAVVTSGSVRVGDVGGIAQRFQHVDPQVLSIVSWVAILATMGLLVIANVKLAPVGGVGMASALSIMGFVAIPMPLLGVAGAISVFVLVGDSQ